MCEHRLGTLLLCEWCRAPFAICSCCYWGQRYCCDGCRDAARRKQCREADERYMQGKVAKELRSQRSRRSREKAKSSRKIDTDHPVTQDASAVIAGVHGHPATVGRPVGVKEAPDDDNASMHQPAEQPAATRQGSCASGTQPQLRLVPAPVERPSLDHCWLCGLPIRWWVESDRLRAKARELRMRPLVRRGPRLSKGPAP